jgi:hypothetical protein
LANGYHLEGRQGQAGVDLPLDGLKILDEVVWFGGPKNGKPTVRNIAEHARDILSADLDWPIIVTQSGEVLDGAHRIARAYLERRSHIRAVLITDYPPPDGVIAADFPK